jgi:hypothetical protein
MFSTPTVFLRRRLAARRNMPRQRLRVSTPRLRSSLSFPPLRSNP